MPECSLIPNLIPYSLTFCKFNPYLFLNFLFFIHSIIATTGKLITYTSSYIHYNHAFLKYTIVLDTIHSKVCLQSFNKRFLQLAYMYITYAFATE